MAWKCACGLNIILSLIFVTVIRILNLVIFQTQIIVKIVGTFYAQILLQFYASHFETLHLFCHCHGLKICMWFASLVVWVQSAE